MAVSTGWRAEISRKILHLCTAVIPLVYLFFDRDTLLGALVAATAVAVLVEILRHTNRRFHALFRRYVGFMVRASEWGRISGATYVLLAALLSVWIFPQEVAIAGLLILSVSDSAASLIGLRFGRGRFLGKSLAGSLAFFVTAVAILWVALPETKGIAFVAAIVATVAEALPAPRLERFELNDNLTIPLLTGAAICAMRHCLGGG